MTFRDLFDLVRHYLIAVLIIVVACATLGVLFGIVKSDNNVSSSNNSIEAPESFIAKATIISSSKIGGVGGVAKAEAESWNDSHNTRYGEWLKFDNERKQMQLENSTNTTSKKSFETSPGSWLKFDTTHKYANLTIVEAQITDSENTVSVYAIGPDSELCVKAANSVAESTKALSEKLFNTTNSRSQEMTLSLNQSNEIVISEDLLKIEIFSASASTDAFSVVDENVGLLSTSRTATSQNSSGSSSGQIKTIAKYGLIGLVVGLAVSIFAVVLIDIIRKPIRNREKLSKCVNAPIIADSSIVKNSDLLTENIILASGCDSSNICIASVSESNLSKFLIDLLNKEMAFKNNKNFVDAGSLTTSGQAVREAHRCNDTVLCVREWKDQMQDLESALNELNIANARIIGVAVLS